nr:prolyl 4-hydroxylase subunit alpha-1-like [Rhipicephalus microplus]
MPGLTVLLRTEKALVAALQRHMELCGNTWRRVALISPPEHLDLRDEPSFTSRARSSERVLLNFLRISVLQFTADVLRIIRCPRPLVENDRLLAWPTEDDVDGAAANVCRLQNAYGLTAADALTTLCSPILRNLLSPGDALSLGVHCSRSERSAASAWVELGEDQRYTDFFYYHLPEMEYSAPKANSTSWQAVVRRPPETPAMWPYREALLGNPRFGFPSDTRFGMLCRDSRDSDARPSGRLRCWLSSGKHGAATLSPLAVEELSLSEPRLWLVHDFLSHDECAALRREATELEPALVNEGNGSDNQPDTRTAALTWLENVGSARRIYERAAVLTGLTMESAEKLQVLNYAAGGHYSEHIDPLDKAQEQGERLATLLVYLSDVKQGGSTAFPKADLSIRPRRGSALFWFNLKQDPPTSARQIDHSTTHGSCPVLRGSKWIATLWMHEWSQPWDLDYSLS